MANTLFKSFIGTAVAQGGTTFTHGLTLNGTSVAPDRYDFHHNGAPPAGTTGSLYFVSANATTIVLASASGATTANLFVEKRHTIIKGSNDS